MIAPSSINTKIGHAPANFLPFWFLKPFKKDAQVTLSDKKAVLNTKIAQDVVSSKLGTLRITISRYSILLIIFFLSVPQQATNVLAFTLAIFGSLLATIVLLRKKNMQTIFSNAVLIIISFIIFYILGFKIEPFYALSMPSIIISFATAALISRSILEKECSNTYYSKKLKTTWWFASKEVSNLKVYLLASLIFLSVLACKLFII